MSTALHTGNHQRQESAGGDECGIHQAEQRSKAAMVRAQRRGIQGGDAMSKPLRQTMPQTAAFIDACREAFGKAHIDGQIRLGMQGAQTFHAVEDGQEVGTRFDVPKNAITMDKMVIQPKQETKPEKWKTKGRK